MSEQPRRDPRAFSASRPFVVHIENSSTLKPVFIVHDYEYEAALKRHPRVRMVRFMRLIQPRGRPSRSRW